MALSAVASSAVDVVLVGDESHLRTVLDEIGPAGPREHLPEFLLRDRDDRARVIEDDGA